MLRDDREETLLHPTANVIASPTLFGSQKFFEIVEVGCFEVGH
jgi:hypothetical protein